MTLYVSCMPTEEQTESTFSNFTGFGHQKNRRLRHPNVWNGRKSPGSVSSLGLGGCVKPKFLLFFYQRVLCTAPKFSSKPPSLLRVAACHLFSEIERRSTIGVFTVFEIRFLSQRCFYWILNKCFFFFFFVRRYIIQCVFSLTRDIDFTTWLITETRRTACVSLHTT